VKASYRPRSKEGLTEEQLMQFRDGFSYYGKILFDFLLSVPLREGQFQQCSNCGQIFHPRWRHITTYPLIAEGSPFVIWPHKGHENENYKQGLRQVCFLTANVAKSLNQYRQLKERKLGRKLEPEEYIFTHQKNIDGTAHVTPISKNMIASTFWRARVLTGISISPHTPRAWVNSILAARGIDKQLRDLYLGHSCAYEENYIMQLIPQWQRTFKEKKALEHLNIVRNPEAALDLEETVQKVQEQQEEIQRLKRELTARTISSEDEKTLKDLLRDIREGKAKIVRTN